MSNLRQIAKQLPGAQSLFQYARHKYQWLTLVGKPTEDVFTNIFQGNKWGGQASVSGRGSDLDQTGIIRKQLPALLREFEVQTMLDIPCGDFNWMRHVDLENVDYTGADIVPALVEQNRQYEKPKIHFVPLNLISDELPEVDLLFCRDCLVHLCYKQIFEALSNVVDSGSTYLLTTTFPDRPQNQDIATGQWRPLNLEVAPFSFPPPVKMIGERSEPNDPFKDKSLGLWRIADLAGFAKANLGKR
jgi:SAM-dependent methyltransferase